MKSRREQLTNQYNKILMKKLESKTKEEEMKCEEQLKGVKILLNSCTS